MVCSNDVEFRKHIHMYHLVGKFLGSHKATLEFLSPSTSFTFGHFYFGDILPGLITHLQIYDVANSREQR